MEHRDAFARLGNSNTVAFPLAMTLALAPASCAPTEPPSPFRSATMTGRLGTVSGSGRATVTEVAHNIDVDAENETERWRMRLILRTAHEIRSYPAGARLTEETAGVSLYGCSGPFEGNFAYDEHMPKFSVEISEIAPGRGRATIVGFIPPFEMKVITATIDYDLPPAAGVDDAHE